MYAIYIYHNIYIYTYTPNLQVGGEATNGQVASQRAAHGGAATQGVPRALWVPNVWGPEG